ncbi:MAG: PEP-CTERM sorting domain-containing protein [Terracidiphilus sp.]|jgi:hypothetical protein
MNSKLSLTTSLCVVVLALFALACAPAFAAPSNPCPTISGTVNSGPDQEGINPTYTTDAAGGATCNVLITFEANGSIVTTNPNAAVSYDGGDDDNLVGIINETGKAISSINLSSAVDDIFGFDGDGICSISNGGYYTFSASGTGGTGACSGVSQGASTGGGYGGPGVTYTGINGANTAGTVNFAGGIAANGGTAFFSLEGPVDLNLQVNNPIPEPSSYLLFGTGLLGLFFFARKKLLA